MGNINSANNLFGRRLKDARLRAGIPQDKLGVIIGLDEGSSSARISRYETGIHEPPFSTVIRIAEALALPTAYFYCEDDVLAEIIQRFGKLSKGEKKEWLSSISLTK